MCFGSSGGGQIPVQNAQAKNPPSIYHPAKDDPKEQFPTARSPNTSSTPYRYEARTGLAVPYGYD